MIITTACTGYVSWNAYARSAARAPASSESNARIARCANRLSRRKCASPSAVPHVATAFSMPACTSPITSVYPSTTKTSPLRAIEVRAPARLNSTSFFL